MSETLKRMEDSAAEKRMDAVRDSLWTGVRNALTGPGKVCWGDVDKYLSVQFPAIRDQIMAEFAQVIRENAVQEVHDSIGKFLVLIDQAKDQQQN